MARQKPTPRITIPPEILPQLPTLVHETKTQLGFDETILQCCMRRIPLSYVIPDRARQKVLQTYLSNSITRFVNGAITIVLSHEDPRHFHHRTPIKKNCPIYYCEDEVRAKVRSLVETILPQYDANVHRHKTTSCMYFIAEVLNSRQVHTGVQGILYG